MRWVKEQPELATPMAPYINRDTIDHYFERVVVHHKGTRNTVRRIVSALQWFANYHEHVGLQFKVDSPTVRAALETQKLNNEISGGTANPGSDPHRGLKDIVPSNQLENAMHYIYSRNDWGPAAVNFSWGHNGAIRGASNRNINLADIKVSYGFGPNESGHNNKALMLVLRKGTTHKDRHETDKQVAVWRHKNYVRCSVFATAAHIIFELSNNNKINFKQERKDAPAEWWKIPLIC